MKSFKEYLTESKKVYEFKVKIIGECPKDCAAQIKGALTQFHVGSVSEGKRTPVQIRHSEFPEHKNLEMSVYDVTLDYPATNHQVRDLIATALGKTLSEVKAMNMAEVAEHDLNHEHDERTGEAFLNKHELEYAPGGQELTSESHKMSFLADLAKDPRTTGTQYKGVNDEILASSMPKHSKETPGKQVKVETKKFANIFTKQVKITDPMKGAK
jgi:hypothetical protein